MCVGVIVFQINPRAAGGVHRVMPPILGITLDRTGQEIAANVPLKPTSVRAIVVRWYPTVSADARLGACVSLPA
jgi:hypothetical protein